MKTLLTIAAFAAVSGSLFAQLNPLPPPSTAEGVALQPIGLNAGVTHWDDPLTLGAYKVVSTTDGNAPISSPTYNPIGLPFASAVPTGLLASLGAINSTGGTIRGIFAAESALWSNDFGYTYSGNPTGPRSYTVAQNVRVNPSPSDISFGSFFDVSLARGEASTFDFWYNGVGATGLDNPTPPTTFGGVYTAIHQTNSMPYAAPGNAVWAQTPILLSTWVPALGAYANVTTYLVAFDDWRVDNASDHDYSDLVMGVQVYDVNNIPFAPVPEPSTYGLIGAASLLGLVGHRRFRAKRSLSSEA